MNLLPLIHTTWGEWRDLHPDTLVPIWETGFEDRYREHDPGRPGISQRFEDTLLNIDDRLAENELVLGAGVGVEQRAYVLGDLPDGLATTHDVLGSHPIVVFSDTGNDFALAYSAVVDGDVRTFDVVDGSIVDNRGTTWDVTGLATAGPDAGVRLQFVTSFVTEWYGWAAYYPETDIFGR